MNAIGEGDEEEEFEIEAPQPLQTPPRNSATSIRSNRKQSPKNSVKKLSTSQPLQNIAKKNLKGVHFAHLRYGKNNEELIFNMDCQIMYLLIYFMEKTNCQLYPEHLDIVDVNGNIKDFRLERNKFKYASTLLEPRGIYVLVDIRNFPKCVSLLQNSELLTGQFFEGLSQIKEVIATPINSQLSIQQTAETLLASKTPEARVPDNVPMGRKKSKDTIEKKTELPKKSKGAKHNVKLKAKQDK